MILANDMKRFVMARYTWIAVADQKPSAVLASKYHIVMQKSRYAEVV